MDKILGTFSDHVYAVLRMVSGFLILWHGSQKLLNYPPQMLPPGTASTGLSPLMAFGGTIELVGGLLVMIGLFASFAGFVVSGMMAFAYFMSHFSTASFLPIVNRGELAVIFCFVFLFIASRGSGIWSVDSVIRSRRLSDE
jgi:putative oxidoreductase